MATPSSTAPSASLERLWWLRALLVLQSPRSVFAALRDDADEDAQARQEPLLAIVLLAGISGVLGTGIAGGLLDDPEFDSLLIAVWAVLGGSVYGLAAYFVVGGLLFFGASFAGSLGGYRRARHIVGFAAAPLALSLTVWPVRLAVLGEDAFRTGGGDEGSAGDVFDAIEVAFIAWALVLLVVGVRTVHGWTWQRALAAAALPALLPFLVFSRAYGLI